MNFYMHLLSWKILVQSAAASGTRYVVLVVFSNWSTDFRKPERIHLTSYSIKFYQLYVKIVIQVKHIQR